MGDLQRENAWFSVKWGILEEKIRDFRVKWKICIEETLFSLKLGILEEKTRELWLKWGICQENTRDFRLNGGFAKRKRMIFA